MATPVSIGNFVTEIVNKRGGPSNPTLYEFDIAPPFSGASKFKQHFKEFGFNWDQELRFLNYLNNEIQIPGVTFQNSEVRQYRKGVPIKMASSKIFNEMDMTFICDVTSMPFRFFRGWMDYIGDVDQEGRYDPTRDVYNMSALSYYYEYTCDLTIKKIEKKPTQTSPLEYDLVRAWPYSVASIPMSHASQNGLVKLSVSMYYEYARAYYSPTDK